MFESLTLSLRSWNTKYSERAKLQHAYLTSAIILLVAAGLIGLINAQLGQQLLAVAIFAALAFLLNAVAWAILQSAIISRLGSRSAASRTRK